MTSHQIAEQPSAKLLFACAVLAVAVCGWLVSSTPSVTESASEKTPPMISLAQTAEVQQPGYDFFRDNPVWNYGPTAITLIVEGPWPTDFPKFLWYYYPIIPSYPFLNAPNNDVRARQLIFHSEDLEKMLEIWEREWNIKMPKKPVPYNIPDGQIIFHSEDLRHVPAWWEWLFLLDMPDIATPYRVNGHVI